jgi:hypothetical protein
MKNPKKQALLIALYMVFVYLVIHAVIWNARQHPIIDERPDRMAQNSESPS